MESTATMIPVTRTMPLPTEFAHLAFLRRYVEHLAATRRVGNTTMQLQGCINAPYHSYLGVAVTLDQANLLYRRNGIPVTMQQFADYCDLPRLPIVVDHFVMETALNTLLHSYSQMEDMLIQQRAYNMELKMQNDQLRAEQQKDTAT